MNAKARKFKKARAESDKTAMMKSRLERSDGVAGSAAMALAGVKCGMPGFQKARGRRVRLAARSALEEEREDLLWGIEVELARAASGVASEVSNGVSRAVYMELLEHLSAGIAVATTAIQ